jgi:GntR family transcriptional regulator
MVATAREQPGTGPLYLSIAAMLRRDISTGTLSPGERLPAIADLATQHRVSVITIRQALALLETEKLIERQQGRGTFVRDHPGVGLSLTLRSDWTSLLEHLEGKTPTLVNMADKVATPMLDPDMGTLEPAYRYMRRVHSYKTLPYALIDIYLAQRVFDLDPEGFTNGMVISRLSELSDVATTRLQQRIAFTTADPQTSALLNVAPNSAIGDVLRVITDADGNAIYIGKTKYRGDFVNLAFDIKEPPR